jgi:hypothetical protein
MRRNFITPAPLLLLFFREACFSLSEEQGRDDRPFAAGIWRWSPDSVDRQKRRRARTLRDVLEPGVPAAQMKISTLSETPAPRGAE